MIPIDDDIVNQVFLLKIRPLIGRWHIIPYSLLYFIPLILFFKSTWLVFGISFGVTAALHALIFLTTLWSIKIKRFLNYKLVDDINEATHVHVVPKPNCGNHSISEIHRLSIDSVEMEECNYSFHIPKITFSFQYITFCCYDTSKLSFSRLDYPDNLLMGQYSSWTGLSTTILEHIKNKYTPNDLSIPLPAFLDLFYEHMIAPFFVLQIFCVLLWSLDDYWYLSFFTFVMLVVFESTLVKQRISHIKMLREMRPDPYEIYCYRNKEWKKVKSDTLYPGDIISVKHRKKKDSKYGNSDTVENTPLLAPCDLLLLNGTCIVNEALLTGESVPQTKESVKYDKNNDFKLSNADCKRNIIYGGTELLQSNCPEGRLTGMANTPNRGCLGVVVRTGYYSSQGELIRTMLYSSERMTANSEESFIFIGILLVFAVLASGYVLWYSIGDPKRNKYKLLLHCIMIITSVVPPELPMELSLAVTASMAALTRLGVFCTEPFRIPYAGKISKCCFDKTGTITSDEITVDGAATNTTEINKLGSIDPITTHIMVGCQSLVFIDNQMGGDPLELAAVKYCGWVMTQNNKLVPSQRMKQFYPVTDKVVILKINPFTSELKRMSCIIATGQEEELMCVCKGAPDILENLFTTKPDNYRAIYRFYSAAGKRVIALGYRNVTKDFLKPDMDEISRESIESDLTFASFLILDSPLKHGSKKTIRRLLESSHEICMITGDDPLTACAVAHRVHMINKGIDKTLILTLTPPSTLEWIPIVEQEGCSSIPFKAKDITNFKFQYDLCVTGSALSYIINTDQELLRTLCDSVFIYARVSPQDKGIIVSTLKSLGHTTLMCGDGTNDVGALKQADVGVSILNNPDLEKRIDEFASQQQAEKEKEKNSKKNSRGHRSREEAIQKANPNENPEKPPRKEAIDVLKDQLTQQLVDQGGVVKLGDASIASPFTCKSPNIDRIVHIIKQGRCTLVTTLQMYKILALNCLTNAIFLSILYLLGVKQGDRQATTMGIITAMYFFAISQSKPLSKLSVEKPASTIFTFSNLFSIFGQFSIHLSIFYMAYNTILPFLTEALDIDADFQPNLLNTIMFIVSATMMNTTFLVNYQGHPFKSSIRENEFLMTLLVISIGLCICVSTQLFPDINSFLELTTIPEEIQQPIIYLLIGDIAGCFVLDYSIKMLNTCLD